MRVIFSYFTFILFSITSFGQVINGKIIAIKDTQPISFANILVKGTQLGTVSNEEGTFELSVKNLKQKFTLVISVIGYKTEEIEITKQIDKPNLIIELEESSLELQEIVITYLSAEQILSNFYKNYTSNYYQGTSISNAFYHSTLSENGEYKHLLEATVNVREYKKKHKRAFEVEITKRRKSNDYRLEQWGEKNNYLFDAISSNPMLELSDFLDFKNLKHYTLKRLANTTYNDELIYVIEFTPKKNVTKPLYNATAYFNSTDYALIKADYYFLNNKENIKNQRLKNKIYHIPFISGSVRYQKIDTYYVQKYLSYDNGWTVINSISNDTIAKDILKDEILFSKTQNNSNTPLSNPLTKWGDIYKKPFPYDVNYWNNQTKIAPSKMFKKAITDLEKQQPIEIQYLKNSSTIGMLQNFENTPSGKIDSILTVYNLSKLFNGVALVTHNGKSIHHKAYGYSDVENKVNIDTSTIFDIGSITKQFTTALILKLRQKGKLSLKDKVGTYLPNYRYADSITIHQLLAHRSGIPTFDYQETLSNSKWFNTKMTTEEMIDSYCSNDLEFEPDSQMEYSNSNFIILTAIIEKIENKDYYSVLNELLFKPLHMTNSYAPNLLPSKNVANGYVLNGNNYTLEPNWQKVNMKGAGCVYSNSIDLLKWINATNGNQFLNTSDVDLIKSPISYYEYYESYFGYSWAINNTLFNTKNPTYFYGGTSLGFYSMITTIPESGINIILLSNKGDFPRIDLTNNLLKVIK
jgi:CubicO group peptidase (beta-lactamase class C family)